MDDFHNEAYEFTWVGKRAAIMEAARPTDKVLRPCPEESKNWETTGNLYLEGDNLDVLKLLQESHAGKVKLIYIDPPYNTGGDFIYRDSQVHSDWCSMIYPRLKLARDLLTDDGAIFVSIDYNESANLRKIMDEIFGEENFQREIIWRIGWLSGYKTVAPNYIRNHDTIYFYAKDSRKLSFHKKYIANENFKPLVKKDKNLTKKMASLGLSDAAQTELLYFINHENRPARYPIEDTWNANEYDDLNSIAIVSYSGEKVSKLLGIDQDFKGQKSVKMLQRILESLTCGEDIILDFFSGTASTAHAVMRLNADDHGKRKTIMVQLPEPCNTEGYPNICEIGKERIRRVGERIQQQGGTGLDIGFRVYKVFP